MKNKSYNVGQSCTDNHIALFCLDNSNTSKRVIKCICVECGEFAKINEEKKETENIIYSNLPENEIFQEYYNIRNRYLSLVTNGMTPEEAVNQINDSYIDNTNDVIKTYKKTTSI